PLDTMAAPSSRVSVHGAPMVGVLVAIALHLVWARPAYTLNAPHPLPSGHGMTGLSRGRAVRVHALEVSDAHAHLVSTSRNLVHNTRASDDPSAFTGEKARPSRSPGRVCRKIFS